MPIPHSRWLSPSLARIAGAGLDAILPAYQGPAFDFSRPCGEPALLAADSLHWRIFKNPVTLFVGGVTAVILELAEPGVSAGVWAHSRFRDDPISRLRHTGHAAMVSIYGARSQAEALIAGVVRMHAGVSGSTAAGMPYSAGDIDLLTWVQATTSFGFAAAYDRYASHLPPKAIDRFYAEAEPASRLYGVSGAPSSQIEFNDLLRGMTHRLQNSPILIQFLTVMRTAPIMPRGLRWLQPLLVRAAVDLIPKSLRDRLALGAGPSFSETMLVSQMAGAADRIPLNASPAVHASKRLGLPGDWLYRRA